MNEEAWSLIERIKKERMTYLDQGHEAMAEEDLEFLNTYDRLYSLVMLRERKGGLNQKMKELILLSCFATRNATVEHLRRHVIRAMKLGASKEEIIDALEISFIPGAASFLFGGRALKEALETHNGK